MRTQVVNAVILWMILIGVAMAMPGCAELREAARDARAEFERAERWAR